MIFVTKLLGLLRVALQAVEGGEEGGGEGRD